LLRMKFIYVVAFVAVCACAAKLPKFPKLAFPRVTRDDVDVFTPKKLPCGYSIKHKLKGTLDGEKIDVKGYDCGYGDSKSFTAKGQVMGYNAWMMMLLRADDNGGHEGYGLSTMAMDGEGVKMCVGDDYEPLDSEFGLIAPYVSQPFAYTKKESSTWDGEKCDAYTYEDGEVKYVAYVKDDRVIGLTMHEEEENMDFEMTCSYDLHAYADDFVISEDFDGCADVTHAPIPKLDDCELNSGSADSAASTCAALMSVVLAMVMVALL